MLEQIGEAGERADDWADGVRASIEAGFEFLRDRETEARAFALAAMRAGPAWLEGRCALIESAALRLKQGRLLYPAAAEMPDGAERTLVAGVVMLASVHLLAEGDSGLPGVEAEAIEMVLTPYVGGGRAREFASASA
jgi:hypothetical protein